MKTLKSAFLILVLALFAGLLSQCSKETEIINPINQVSHQKDGPTLDNVRLIVEEYVLVIPSQGESWYEWRTLATFGCGTGECFSPYIILDDEFTTPASQRYEGSNTIRSRYFKFVYGCTWGNTPGFGGHLAVWKVGTYGIYLRDDKVYDGYGGEYVTMLDNVDLPHSTTIPVKYGSDTITK